MKSVPISSALLSLLLWCSVFQAAQASTILTADHLQAGVNNTFQAMISSSPFYPPVNATTSPGMLAVGFGNFIHSTGSAVIGYQNTVWMKNSFAIGQGNEVGQDFSSLTNNTGSVAIGTDNHVAGSDSLVIGVANSANYVLNYEDDEGAKRSLIVGNWNMSEGHNSVIVGENNSIGSSYSYALIPAHNTAVFGSGLISKYDNCTIVGKNNAAVFTPYNQSPPLFVVGNGVSTSTRADALVIKANGDMKLQGNIDASGIVTCSPGGNIPMFTGN